jgi:hypothetical protein
MSATSANAAPGALKSERQFSLYLIDRTRPTNPSYIKCEKMFFVEEQ